MRSDEAVDGVRPGRYIYYIEERTQQLPTMESDNKNITIYITVRYYCQMWTDHLPTTRSSTLLSTWYTSKIDCDGEELFNFITIIPNNTMNKCNQNINIFCIKVGT